MPKHTQATLAFTRDVCSEGRWLGRKREEGEGGRKRHEPLLRVLCHVNQGSQMLPCRLDIDGLPRQLFLGHSRVVGNGGTVGHQGRGSQHKPDTNGQHVFQQVQRGSKRLQNTEQ